MSPVKFWNKTFDFPITCFFSDQTDMSTLLNICKSDPYD